LSVDDPKDDPIVQTAVAGTADVLCARDRRLYHSVVREYCAPRGIEMFDDVALLGRLRSDEARESLF
jgi:hypothetical protein